MFRVNRREVTIEESVGGQPRTSDVLPEKCVDWLDQAAIIAQQLLEDEAFPTLFTRHAPPDTCNIRLVHLLRKKLESMLPDLHITVNIAEIGGDMASYVRNVSGAVVSSSININKSLLRALHRSYLNAPDESKKRKKKANRGSKTKLELESQWIALLAIKMFHEANHMLLTLLDSPTLRLIGVLDDGSRCTPPKKFGTIPFDDFGNLMERAAFGGIVGISDNWEGNDLILASDESWQRTEVILSLEPILKGVIDELKTGDTIESETEEEGTKRAKRASTDKATSSASAASSAIVSELPPSVAEPKVPAFLPEADWDTAFTKPTKRA